MAIHEGKAGARVRGGKRTRAWIAGIGLGILAGLLLGLSQAVDPSWAPIVQIVAAGIFVIALIQGTMTYMASIDEHERHANLRAAYVGLVVYLGLYCVQALAAVAGYPMAWGQHAIFGFVCFVTLSVYLWDRYR